MKKTLAFFGILAMTSMATIALAAAQAPDTVVFDKVAAKQPAVTFAHAEHVERVESCDTCHHTNKGLTAAKAAEDKACTSCHTEALGALGTVADMSPTKNPLHATCMGCHKEQKKGPTKCAECHVK